MRRAPWHSTRPGDGVYHDNDQCADGKFPAIFRAEGTRGRPLCYVCARLGAGRPALLSAFAAETSAGAGRRNVISQ